MAESVQEKHWYLAVGDRSIGPLTTGLVARGIESGKVPLTAWICPVGANSWSALSSLGEFQDVVDRVMAAGVPANQQSRDSGSSYHPPTKASASAAAKPTVVDTSPADNEPASVSAAVGALASDLVDSPADEDDLTGRRVVLPYEQPESQGLPSFNEEVRESDFLSSADSQSSGAAARAEELPSFAEESGQREVLPNPSAGGWSLDAPPPEQFDEARAAARAAARASHDDLGIDITFDEDHENAIDWKERFQSYFLVGTEVELPEEERLLQSLLETPRSTFLHDEALWNLSLCLAFGSDVVANTSARTFFEAVGSEHASERIEWICRTLLSKGFMPSGIPRSEGMRGIDMLRSACPEVFSEVLERESMD